MKGLAISTILIELEEGEAVFRVIKGASDGLQVPYKVVQAFHPHKEVASCYVRSSTIVDGESIPTIWNLFVIKELRGYGIGSQFVSAVADDVTRQNSDVGLICGNELVDFYENAGFEVISRATSSYGENVLLWYA